MSFYMNKLYMSHKTKLFIHETLVVVSVLTL